MGRIKILSLTPEQKADLEKGLKFGSCHRFRMRCQGILLKSEGKSVNEISKIVGFGPLPIYNWIKRFEESGVEGLREKGGRGAKPLMSPSDTEDVRKAVQDHRESIKKAKAAWEEATDREVSESTFRRFLELLAQDINV